MAVQGQRQFAKGAGEDCPLVQVLQGVILFTTANRTGERQGLHLQTPEMGFPQNLHFPDFIWISPTIYPVR